MVLSKSQTEPCSVRQAPKMKCTKVWKMTAIKISAVSFKGCYFLWIYFRENAFLSIIMTTTGIKWCNDGIPENLWILLKNMFFDQKKSKFWLLSENFVHMTANANLKTPSKSGHSNARYEFVKIKSNKELHFPVQIAINNRKFQNGLLKTFYVLLTDGQNEMRFPVLCFLIEREHF